MRRRAFTAGLGCLAVAWPVVGRAQQADRVRRIGALMNLAAGDAEGQSRIAAFRQALQKAGWAEGKNVTIETRWTAGHAERTRRDAAELISLSPDVILASSSPTARALLDVTRAVPIVFASATDPVGIGLVESLPRPGGNATGFTQFEVSFSAKLVELLKDVASHVKRAAVLHDPTNPTGVGQFRAIQGAASALGYALTSIGMRDGADIERGITAFAGGPDCGLIVPPSTAAAVNRALIIELAARLRLPAVYSLQYFVRDGGLLAYGPDLVDQYRRAAGYVDRILKGEKPAELPVQAPIKYELAINLKTAKALSLTVPPTLLARADEVIE